MFLPSPSHQPQPFGRVVMTEAVEVSNGRQTEVLLGVRNLTKSYGGVTVLDDVSVDFTAGQVHALLGENGAGKSTLVKIIAGVIAADSGQILGSAHESGDVAMVFQELSVVPEMSVLDNLALAGRSRGVFVPYRSVRETAADALTSAGLFDIDLDWPVAALSLAQRQLLEIARGLMASSRVLILDEPTATLSDVEIERVHGVVRTLVASGHSVIYITHRLGEVFTLSDRITIMRGGRVVASADTAAFVMRDVVAHMLGADHVPVDKHAVSVDLSPAQKRARALSLEKATSRGRFQDVSFTAEPGAVLAIFGQVGSGADEVVKSLAGMSPLDSGVVTLGGQTLQLGTRARSQRQGVGYVSADRTAEGVFLETSVEANISSGALGRVSDAGVIRQRKERGLARALARVVALDPDRIRERVLAFSGGNQQKVAVARALATQPRLLLLNEPTRGVDIGARSEIYRSIRGLLGDDVIVVVYSSDIVEIRELADHVVTMYRGSVVDRHVVDDISDPALITEILNGGAS